MTLVKPFRWIILAVFLYGFTVQVYGSGVESVTYTFTKVPRVNCGQKEQASLKGCTPVTFTEAGLKQFEECFLYGFKNAGTTPLETRVLGGARGFSFRFTTPDPMLQDSFFFHLQELGDQFISNGKRCYMFAVSDTNGTKSKSTDSVKKSDGKSPSASSALNSTSEDAAPVPDYYGGKPFSAFAT
eukprot:929177_1